VFAVSEGMTADSLERKMRFCILIAGASTSIELACHAQAGACLSCGMAQAASLLKDAVVLMMAWPVMNARSSCKSLRLP
jgi:hypothetical protein